MIPLAHPNDSNRMIPHAYPNDANRMIPLHHANDSNRMIPLQHPNDSNRMIPLPHPNDSNRMIPHDYQNDSNRMIPLHHANDSNRMIPLPHPNDSNRMIPHAYPNDANRMIPLPHPNDANRTIPLQHPNGVNRMIPHDNQNDANGMILQARPNDANRMIPHVRPNDANGLIPQTYQNDANRITPTLYPPPLLFPQQSDANRMNPYINAQQAYPVPPTLRPLNNPFHQIRPQPNSVTGPNLYYGRPRTTVATNANMVYNDHLLPYGRMCMGGRQIGTDLSLFHPRPSRPLFVDERSFAYNHPVPNRVPRPFILQGRSRDDMQCHTSLTGHYVGDSRRRGISTVIVDNRDMVLRASLRISSTNQHWFPVESINTPLPLQGPLTQLQSNNQSTLLFQYIFKSILSTMANLSLDVHNAAAVVIAREYQVRVTALTSQGQPGSRLEYETLIQSMRSMDLMFSLHISREALRPMPIIWNHNERRQMTTKELFEIFWVTGLPAAERPKLGVAVCVIYGDPVAKLFASDITMNTHAESTMIDFLSRVLISERMSNMPDPSQIIHVEVFQNYSPCGDCSKKYFLLFNEFARFGIRVKITIHFVSLYKLYWDIANPQGNLEWLTVEEHCDNRDWLLKLMNGVLDMYTFNEITWIRLLGALGIEVGRGIIPKYVGCGRLKADTWAAQTFNRLKEFGATQYPPNDIVAFLNRLAISGGHSEIQMGH